MGEVPQSQLPVVARRRMLGKARDHAFHSIPVCRFGDGSSPQTRPGSDASPQQVSKAKSWVGGASFSEGKRINSNGVPHLAISLLGVRGNSLAFAVAGWGTPTQFFIGHSGLKTKRLPCDWLAIPADHGSHTRRCCAFSKQISGLGRLPKVPSSKR